MGLRINTNVSALGALRNLHVSTRNQGRSLERLSTGLRINRASDDPSGLVISEQLRAQVSSLKQAVSNSQNAAGLIGTTDAALQEVADLLSGIKDSAVFALNEGGSSTQQLAAEQAAVDQAIGAISRIANTTRYAGRNLLDGSSGFQFLSSAAPAINDLRIRRFDFAAGVTSAKVTLSVATVATRRLIHFAGAGASGAVIRITGNRGTAELSLVPLAGEAAVIDAINKVAGSTGVFADDRPFEAHAFAEEFGSKSLNDIRVVSGTMVDTFGTHGAGESLFVEAKGVDGVVVVAGQSFKGDGRFFDIHTEMFSFSFNFAESPDTPPAFPGYSTVSGAHSFKLSNSGLNFQLNERAQGTDSVRIGIGSVVASALGAEAIVDRIATHSGAPAGTTQFGFLESLKTGGANDLDTNPGNALKTVNQAIDQVSALRGVLGALQARTIEPNIEALGVAIENLTAAESAIRDLDFAEETSTFTRAQVLFQAGTAVLASANLIPRSVLTLLR